MLTSSRSATAVALIFVFLCFFPYPAVDVGNSTGLQLSHMLALVMLPFVAVRYVSSRHALTLALVLLAAALSAVVTVLSDPSSNSDRATKALAEITLSLAVMIPVGWIIARVGFRRVVPAICAALIVQGLVGLDQFVQFQSNQFPLFFVYHNASFQLTTQVAHVLATYEKRPFGIFPEPSAMVASIGPWVLLLFGLLLFPSLRQQGGHRFPLLLWVGAVSGGVLIAMSRGGDSAIVAACAAVIAVAAALASRKSVATAQTRATVMIAAAALLGTITVTVLQLTQRVQSQTGLDPSWVFRLTSIRAGLGFLGEGLRQLVFGVGPGQAQGLIIASNVNAAGAIDSDAGRFIAECGLLGGTALLVVMVLVLRAVWQSRARAVGYACVAAWLGSVVLTTSYLTLSPLWVFLGVLLEWDTVFAPRGATTLSGAELPRTAPAARLLDRRWLPAPKSPMST